MTIIRPFLLSIVLAACPSGTKSPTVDADAVAPVVTGVCDLIEGIDDNGAIRSICATVEEIVTVIGPFIVSLLATSDAGVVKASCEPLPHTAVCATSAQRAKAISHLVRVRSARLMLDGGSK